MLTFKLDRWTHAARLSADTITLLAKRHGNSIQTLELNNFNDLPLTRDDRFANLTDLKVEFFHWTNSEWLGSIIVGNQGTLTTFKIESDRSVVRTWQDVTTLSDMGAESHTTALEEGIRKAAQRPLGNTAPSAHYRRGSSALLGITSLHLASLALGIFVDVKTIPVFNLNVLTCLTLEACLNVSQFLGLARSTRNPRSRWSPKLRSFRLRHHDDSDNFSFCLSDFLLSFRGLEDLHILLEGNMSLVNPEAHLKNHGSTVRTLVWDQRTGPVIDSNKATYTLNTNGKVSVVLAVISKICPELRELGLVVDLANDRKYDIVRTNNSVCDVHN